MVPEPQLAARARDLEPAEDILDDLFGFVGDFVFVGEDEKTILATWIIHTHAIRAAYQTPYLHVSSPLKRCGKTRLLETIAPLCSNSFHTQHMSLAAIQRILSLDPLPTLLLDEIDNIFRGRSGGNKALAGLINAGNRLGATVIRVENGQIVEWPVFGAKVLCGIGQTVPDTITDRAIPIRLRRKTDDEKIKRYRFLEVAVEAARLHDRARAWAQEHVPALREANPELPQALTDRQQDAVEPLLAIADAAGARWSGRLRQALLAVLEPEGGYGAGDEPLALTCLRDCKAAWEYLDQREKTHHQKLRSEQLYQVLKLKSPMWNNRTGFSERELAWFLKAWDIQPKKLRIDGATYQGYLRAAFAPAWERYL